MLANIQRIRAKERDALVQMLIKEYQTRREALEGATPEIVKRLDQLLGEPAALQERAALVLTERERRQRLDALSNILRRLEEGNLSSADALAGLEHAAALLEDGIEPLPRESLLKLLRKGTRLTARSQGKTATKVLRPELQAVRQVNLIRGVILHLSWDGKLVKVTVTPEQVAQRETALAFVGIARDDAADVAKDHDYYLAQETVRG